MKSEIYETFMKEYRIKHEVCPKCGTKSHISTLLGYIFNSSTPDEYKDLNRCTCSNCGDVMHITKELVWKNLGKITMSDILYVL